MSTNRLLSDLINRDARRLMQVALGQQTGDLAIVNATLANVYTGEFQKNQAIVTSGKWIAYVGSNPADMIGDRTETIDAAGQVLIPGLIDGHTHLATFYNIAEFLKYAACGGTTTVVTEAFEPFAVGGYAGVVDFFDSLADQPIKLLATAPPMVSISRQQQGVDPEDLERMLVREEVLGMGESYWQGIFQSPEIFLPALQATLAAGKTLEGHSAGAKDGKLAAYTALGITSCHEPITAEQALERMRMGIHVMAREGNVREDLAAISAVRDQGIDLRRLTVVSDGIDARDLMRNGYMETLVQKAMGHGFTPMEAIQMTTLNVAEHFGLDHLIGGIAPGRYADLVLIPAAERIEARVVISSGRVIAREKTLLVAPRAHAYTPASRHSVQLERPLSIDDFRISSDSEASQVSVRVIEMVTDLVTKERVLEVPVLDGQVRCDPDRDLIKVAAVDRKYTPGQTFTGLIQGFGMRAGAIGSSVAWDTSNLIVIGSDEADMVCCINRIHQLQGGLVVCRDQKIVAELALPVLGMISDLEMPDLVAELENLSTVIKSMGVGFDDPMLTLATLTGAAIPYLRICEEGLVNLKTGQSTDVVIAKGGPHESDSIA